MSSKTTSSAVPAFLSYFNEKGEKATLADPTLLAHVHKMADLAIPSAQSAINGEVAELTGWSAVADVIVASDCSFSTKDGKTDYAGKSDSATIARAAIFTLINRGLNLEEWAQVTGREMSSHPYRKRVAVLMEGARKARFAADHPNLTGSFSTTGPMTGGHLTGKMAAAFESETGLKAPSRTVRKSEAKAKRDAAVKADPTLAITVSKSKVTGKPVEALNHIAALLGTIDVAKTRNLTGEDRTKFIAALTTIGNMVANELEAMAPAKAPARTRKAS